MLNGDIATDFEIDTRSEGTLTIRNDGSVNRTKITAQDVRSTAFTARLTHVQYGHWDGDDAVLLCFAFQFRFRNESVKRIIAASIRVTLEETQDAALTVPSPRNPRNDPQIVLIAPVQVCGELTKESKTRSWSLAIPVKYRYFGAEAGLEAEIGRESEVDIDHKMWINGFTDSDDAHHDDNAVVWETQENEGQQSGILHHFPTALVARLPQNPEHPVKVQGRVTPSVAFSLNPLRLVQKTDDAVFLDRRTPKGTPFAPGLDFRSPDFPWNDVVKIPTEYADQLTT